MFGLICFVCLHASSCLHAFECVGSPFAPPQKNVSVSISIADPDQQRRHLVHAQGSELSLDLVVGDGGLFGRGGSGETLSCSWSSHHLETQSVQQTNH